MLLRRRGAIIQKEDSRILQEVWAAKPYNSSATLALHKKDGPANDKRLCVCSYGIITRAAGAAVSDLFTDQLGFTLTVCM